MYYNLRCLEGNMCVCVSHVICIVFLVYLGLFYFLSCYRVAVGSYWSLELSTVVRWTLFLFDLRSYFLNIHGTTFFTLRWSSASLALLATHKPSVYYHRYVSVVRYCIWRCAVLYTVSRSSYERLVSEWHCSLTQWFSAWYVRAAWSEHLGPVFPQQINLPLI